MTSMRSSLLWHKLWYDHNDLHDGIHVAAVAEVMDAGEAGTVKRLQLTAALLQCTPLPHSLVYVQLQLGHRLLGLQWTDDWHSAIHTRARWVLRQYFHRRHICPALIVFLSSLTHARTHVTCMHSCHTHLAAIFQVNLGLPVSSLIHKNWHRICMWLGQMPSRHQPLDFILRSDCRHTVHYTVSQKNDTDIAHYNFNAHQRFW